MSATAQSSPLPGRPNVPRRPTGRTRNTLAKWTRLTPPGPDQTTPTGSDPATPTGPDPAMATGSDRTAATGSDQSTLTGSGRSTATGSGRSTLAAARPGRVSRALARPGRASTGSARSGGAPGGAVWPGVVVAAVAVVFSLLVSHHLPALTPAVVAVASGATLATLTGVGERFRPGLAFMSRRVLRVAIALLGLQIALPQVLALGWQTLAVVSAATGLTFAVTPSIGRRLGLTRGTSLLIATGVSICGAAAIAAMREGTSAADDGDADDDAARALGVVVLYGTAAIPLIPLLASLMGLSPAQLAVWTGAAVHEVAQVAAIGAASGVLAAAVTVKLARVVLLAPLVALTSSLHRRHAAAPVSVHAAVHPAGHAAEGASVGTSVRGARPPIVPLFVAAFLAMVTLRSTGLVPAAVTEVVPPITNVLMAAALFGLGTGIDLRRLFRGGRAVLLGGIATAIIAVTSLAGVALLV
ncbi:putative sulfate exporter family transporter [Nonomuraea sp. NPDC050643]|uniref:YeiH family protein n=1 Tax=Nonomuraea sp. NPDC050643 TaxID=3155660 RepID=UPI0033D70BFE